MSTYRSLRDPTVDTLAMAVEWIIETTLVPLARFAV